MYAINCVYKQIHLFLKRFSYHQNPVLYKYRFDATAHLESENSTLNTKRNQMLKQGYEMIP